ncbi:MAG: hypothetical protein J4G10_04030 [Alphaproteobacteria bacterium]|nr:hypothetical protein [Alphaproteobacteria bacterium]
MIRVLGCIANQHDSYLVVLAIVLCICACAAAMSMFARARMTTGRAHIIWIWCSGAVGGFGIWATHFVAMLAYQTSFPIFFAPSLTFLSMLIASVMCGVGFQMSLSRLGSVAGGLVVGFAIVSMHYVGMMAVQAPADHVWDMNYVTASVVIGVISMACGMALVVRRNSLRGYVAGAGIFTLAIVAMHFTAMTAFALDPNPSLTIPDITMPPGTLAVGIAAVAFLAMALGLVGVLFDTQQTHVRSLRDANAKLEQLTYGLTIALDESQCADRAKAAFLAAISHELRTPLNAIVGFSVMLKDEAFGPLGHPRNVQYVCDIYDSGMQLLSLINNVLDISHMDAGKLKPKEKTLSIDDIVDKALGTIEEHAMKAGVRVSKNVPPDTPQLVADPRRIEQAICNLLSNAVKFTPHGGSVEISVSVDGKGFHITIADSGIGIAEEHLPKVFERFVQLDSTLARKYEGAGLGLPICKQLVELHGGTLKIESTPHVGTTATITLPASRIAKNSAVEAA